MNTKKDQARYLTLPISALGKNTTVTLGGAKAPPFTAHFSVSNSTWLEEFLEEMNLSDENINGEIQIKKEDTIHRCVVHIEFEPQLECARCLCHFRQKITAQGHGFFTNKQFSDLSKQHSISGEYNDEICLSEEDMEAYVYQGNSLQLDEIILDTMQTNLPDIELCHPLCRGLCAQCGENLNEVNSCMRPECKTEFVKTH